MATLSVDECKRKIDTGEFSTLENESGKSPAWKNFLLIIDVVTKKGVGFVKCKICNDLRKFESSKLGTSNLLRHISSCHDKKQVVANLDVPSSAKKDVLNSCINYCTKDLRSFNSIKGTGFNVLAQELIIVGATLGAVNVEKVLPHPTTISRNIVDRANQLRIEILPEILEAVKKSQAAGTTDLWTEEYTKVSYYTVTLHYIREWVLKSRVLFTTAFPPEKKTGENINREVINRLEKFGIPPDESKKIVFVTDRGANGIKAFELWERLNCADHGINTVLTHTFKNDVHFNPLIISVKGLVTYFKKSGLVSRLQKTLNQETDTRWNSHLPMLKSVEEQFPAITDILVEQEQIDKIENIDLEKLRALIKFLQPFKDATTDLEGDRSPTLPFVLLWKKRLLQHCVPDEEDDVEMRLLKKKSAKLIEDKLKLDILHKVATFLVPKFRQMRMLDPTEREEVERYIKSLIETTPTTMEIPPNISSSQESESPEVQKLPKRMKVHDFGQWEDVSSSTRHNVDEVENYLACKTDFDGDILGWWKLNGSSFPNLTEVVKKIMCIPASSASSERSFSAAGFLISERRSKIKPEIVDATLFLHNNLDLEPHQQAK